MLMIETTIRRECSNQIRPLGRPSCSSVHTYYWSDTHDKCFCGSNANLCCVHWCTSVVFIHTVLGAQFCCVWFFVSWCFLSSNTKCIF